MNSSQIKILKFLLKNSLSIDRLANLVGLSRSQVYRLIKPLIELGLVEKNDVVRIADSDIGFIFKNIAEKYNIEILLKGRAIDILYRLIKPKSFRELYSSMDISEATLYSYISKLKNIGVVKYYDGKYVVIEDDELTKFISILNIRKYLKYIEPEAIIVFRGENFILKKVPVNIKAVGSLTGFSLFPKYGLNISQTYSYYIFPSMNITIEHVLFHAILSSKTRFERTLCALFYLKNRVKIDLVKLRRMALNTPAEKVVLNMESYVAGLPIRNPELFLPWHEFKSLAEIYGVKVKESMTYNVLEKYFREMAEKLERNVDAYIFGGFNLVMKNIKIATKDIDLIVESIDEYNALEKAFLKSGYTVLKIDFWSILDKKVMPSNIFIKNSLRIDVFTKYICREIRLTEGMKNRAVESLTFNLFKIRFMSLEDVVLLKCIAGRERDIEDIALIISKYNVSWRKILEIFFEQDRSIYEKYALQVLNSIEILEKEYNIYVSKRVKSMLRKTALKYFVRKALEMGYRTPREIRKLIDFPLSDIRRCMKEINR